MQFASDQQIFGLIDGKREICNSAKVVFQLWFYATAKLFIAFSPAIASDQLSLLASVNYSDSSADPRGTCEHSRSSIRKLIRNESSLVSSEIQY